MIILIPMGGHGSRFSKAGYKLNKACIPTTDRHTGEKKPMVVCAMKDMPHITNKSNKIICINRLFHAEQGIEKIILNHFPNTIFIHDHVLLDQAYACFLAREFLQSNEELFIGTCDNGFDYDEDAFKSLKKKFDVIMFSHTNDNNIAQNPNAHSWAELGPDDNSLKSLSLKKTVSLNPMQDHATTGMFWFKHANVFLEHLETMIWNKDTLNGKYYVDKILQYCIESGLRVGYFDVKYICWGTPLDYENYEKTMAYWKKFASKKHIISNQDLPQ